ncbi:hypothetical protein EST38_g7783 [Candolleomyces aberdarensis]|uniref:Uncharacterized protein n=1 Tax=Candolleomyces aberdarensis TaxID=2316362 RepID=A0A4Q2DEB6_9AGAR|nr:hypothetical protein EST38_g7783 [Candolleomyces aberdarensis]
MIILSPILANAHRLKEFTEKLPTLLFQRFAMQQISFPRLQALTLDSGGLYPNEFPGDETCVVDAPLLRKLELSSLLRDGWTPTFLDYHGGPPCIKIPWSQLTYFSSKYNDLDCESFEEVCAFLSQMPNLETFILQEDAVYDQHADWKVQQGKPRYLFERLKTLRVLAAHSAMFPLLGIMRTPHLKRLNLELQDGPLLDGALRPEDYEGYSDTRGAWEGKFVTGITGLLDTLESRSSVTSLGLWGFQRLPIVKIVKQLPSLRKLATDDLEEELIDFLFSGWQQDLGTTSAGRTIPDLQSLTFEIDCYSEKATKTPHGTNERILQMIQNRLQTGQETKLEHVRIMYESFGRSILKDVFLDPLGKWTDPSSSHRIRLNPLEIDMIHGKLLFFD